MKKRRDAGLIEVKLVGKYTKSFLNGYDAYNYVLSERPNTRFEDSGDNSWKKKKKKKVKKED